MFNKKCNLLQHKEVLRQVKKTLSDRRLIEADFALSLSEGRENKIKNLHALELQKLHSILVYFDDKALLKGIYEIMMELKVIQSLSSESKDFDIIKFLKNKGFITNFTNELPVKNHTSKTIIIQEPLSKMTYIEKYVLVKLLGDFYIKRLATLN